jgi:hypothetical protein
MAVLNLNWPDQTYSSSNKPSAETLQQDLIAIETVVNAIAATTTILADGSVEFTDDQSMGGNKLTTLGTPTAAQDAVNKTYSDAGTQTLTNKTLDLTDNTVNGTTAQFNAALSDGDFATLAGAEELTNKTLTSPTLTNPSGLDSGDISDFTDGSGASGYIKIGNLLIQWGETASLTTSNNFTGDWYYSSDANVTFPQSFKAGTTPKVTLGLGGSAGGALANSQSPSDTGFTARLIGWSNSESSTIQWTAIGVYQ